MYLYRILLALLLLLSIGGFVPYQQDWSDQEDSEVSQSLHLKKVIKGNIRPKSIVHSGNGRFFAQNMMYRHSVTVYDRNYTLLKTIKDQVNPKKLGQESLPSSLRGSPVEVAFDKEGAYAYVSNYKMYGPGFNKPGQDNCVISENYDASYVYKINTQSLEIESLIEVGSVPKFLSVSPNGKILLVSNWCSGDLSVIDLETEEELRRIKLGKYPRGIAIDSKSSFA
ncbi:MAG: YncE family protein, partial [Bacteroidota bacterium]